ncbi:MAG TPA: glycosyltransferase [Usitatibacter sp.]|nr:glycosyltransferase [Usitatibacter sp.]
MDGPEESSDSLAVQLRSCDAAMTLPTTSLDARETLLVRKQLLRCRLHAASAPARTGIPRLVHLLKTDSGGADLPLLQYLCYRSVLAHCKGYAMVLHAPEVPRGRRWAVLLPHLDVRLSVPPQFLGSHRLFAAAHQSDVWRVQQLLAHGGYYFDWDLLLLRDPEALHANRCVMALERKEDGYDEVLGVSAIGAEPGSVFLESWLGAMAAAFNPRRYVAHSTVATCANADLGFFVSTFGASVETQAAPGSFTSVRGSTAPTLCSPGFYQPASGATECGSLQPGPGSFVGASGASAPTPAPAGSFVPLPGATAPTACAGGFFQASPGQADCSTPTPAGTFTTGGASVPTACPAGTYQNIAGQTTCNPAPGGSFTLAGATIPVACSPGSFQPLTGRSACTPAGAGFFVPTSGATGETACAAGTTSSPGATQCVTAQFALSIAKSGTGTGTVTSAPAGISCGSACLASFDTGASVALTATPDASSIFSGWGGACSGSAACNVTMDSAKSVTADFEPSTSIPRLGNISTRMDVLTGNNVMIAGFVIGGSTPKTVAITATGPSLAAFGIANPLPNPMLTLVRQSDHAVIATNDDWQADPNASQLTASGFAPTDPREAGIVATLPPGAYTAIVSGAGNGVGVSVVGVFELDHPEVPLVNISTRGFVQGGNNVMIAGLIVQGNGPQQVVITATGPSLAPFGITNPLANPTLTLVRQSDHAVIGTNDDWQTNANAADIMASGFAPTDPLESALLVTLDPGAYTAIVSGVGGTGVSVVGVFTVP